MQLLGTQGRKLIQRAGRSSEPQRTLSLTISASPTVKSELLPDFKMYTQNWL